MVGWVSVWSTDFESFSYLFWDFFWRKIAIFRTPVFQRGSRFSYWVTKIILIGSWFSKWVPFFQVGPGFTTGARFSYWGLGFPSGSWFSTWVPFFPNGSHFFKWILVFKWVPVFLVGPGFPSGSWFCQSGSWFYQLQSQVCLGRVLVLWGPFFVLGTHNLLLVIEFAGRGDRDLNELIIL